MGKSSYGVKDVIEFTNLLLHRVRQGRGETNSINEGGKFVGRVKTIVMDKFGYKIGFISRLPSDILFHENSNKQLDFSNLKDKVVEYTIYVSPKDGKQFATDVKVIR